MKKFYHIGINEIKSKDNFPILSYQTLESGSIIIWQDKTINALIEKI